MGMKEVERNGEMQSGVDHMQDEKAEARRGRDGLQPRAPICAPTPHLSSPEGAHKHHNTDHSPFLP